MWNSNDRDAFAALGIDLELPEQPLRAHWAAERALQAAADGQLLASYPDDGYYEVFVSMDGRDVTDGEYRIIADLVEQELLTWRGIDLTPSTQGRELLNQWSRYTPFRGGDQV